MNTQQKLGFGHIFFRLASVVAMAGAAACSGAPSGGANGGSGGADSAGTGCVADSTITGCTGGSIGYSCVASDTPTSSLNCSSGTPGNGGEMLFCCTGGGDGSNGSGKSGSNSGLGAPSTNIGDTAPSNPGDTGAASGKTGTDLGTPSSPGTDAGTLSSPGTAPATPGSPGIDAGASSPGADAGTSGNTGTGRTGTSATAFVGTWDMTGTETFTNCVGAVASASATDPFSAVVTWTVGGPGLIGTTPSGCDFDDTASGNTATLAGGSAVCSGIASNGIPVTNTFDSFTWVLGADGTTATVSQTGSQTFTEADGESGFCDLVLSLTATRQ